MDLKKKKVVKSLEIEGIHETSAKGDDIDKSTASAEPKDIQITFNQQRNHVGEFHV